MQHTNIFAVNIKYHNPSGINDVAVMDTTGFANSPNGHEIQNKVCYNKHSEHE
jgi:hypothetical protein